MKTTAILLSFFGFTAFATADDKKDSEVVRVYCSSGDLEAGFKDKVATAFCKEVGKNGEKKKSLMLAETKDVAHAVVTFLGSGTFTRRGETTVGGPGYAWTPDQTAHNASAVVAIASFNKQFSDEGTGFQAVGGVADQIEEWIRENRETILEKAAEK